MRMSYKFHAIFRPEPEGGFTASVPSLPGCVSFGKTLVEARRMIEDAIAGYIVSLKKHGERVPTDECVFSSEIEIAQSPSKKAYAA